MNVNLDPHIIKKFRLGNLIDRLYRFEVHWVNPETQNQPYETDKSEVVREIVAGATTLDAFKQLRFKRIPILYGRLK
jgi:hypothetical protein